MASKENIYFLRSFLLLIEGGLYISKEILTRECQKPDTDLDELLQKNKQKLKHSFHVNQYRKLYPESDKTDIKNWDLQLSVGVLINVFGRDLKSGEKVKLKLLRDLRNDIYMHCTTAALDESKYEDIVEDLGDIITTLASTFDISVQQRCSNCIKQFTSGPLDAVRPSLQTLNGFSQSYQRTFQVGVQTELVICGPSSNWITLCEQTLETIFNHAESMASEDGGFQEIQENVKRMLSYLESNKAAVFKGCERKCIILFFECKDYESLLNFLHKVECQEYTCYLGDLSSSLHSFFKPRNPISITSKVTSESLQSVLIDIIKSLSNEKEEQRQIVEISSEESIHDNMAMASRDVNKETKAIKQSETTLLMNLELIHWEALPQMLQSFQGKQFADSLTKVASSLSYHYGGEINLKASMNVGAVLEALEESVSNEVTLDRETKKSESIYAKIPKRNEFPLLPGTLKKGDAYLVTDQKEIEDGKTSNMETKSEDSEYNNPVHHSEAVQTGSDTPQKDTQTSSWKLLGTAKKGRRHTIDMGFEKPASQYSKAKVKETSSLEILGPSKKGLRHTIDIGFEKPASQYSKAKVRETSSLKLLGHVLKERRHIIDMGLAKPALQHSKAKGGMADTKVSADLSVQVLLRYFECKWSGFLSQEMKGRRVWFKSKWILKYFIISKESTENSVWRLYCFDNDGASKQKWSISMQEVESIMEYNVGIVGIIIIFSDHTTPEVILKCDTAKNRKMCLRMFKEAHEDSQTLSADSGFGSGGSCTSSNWKESVRASTMESDEFQYSYGNWKKSVRASTMESDEFQYYYGNWKESVRASTMESDEFQYSYGQDESTLPKRFDENADCEHTMTDNDSSAFMSVAGCSDSFVSVGQSKLDLDSHIIGTSEGDKKSDHVMIKEITFKSLQVDKAPDNEGHIQKHSSLPHNQEYYPPGPLSESSKEDRVPPFSVQGIKDESAESSNGICSEHDEKITSVLPTDSGEVNFRQASTSHSQQTKVTTETENTPQSLEPRFNIEYGNNTYENITFFKNKEQNKAFVNENESKRGSNSSIDSTFSFGSSTDSVTYESPDEGAHGEKKIVFREEEYYCERPKDIKRNLQNNPPGTFLICNTRSKQVLCLVTDDGIKRFIIHRQGEKLSLFKYFSNPKYTFPNLNKLLNYYHMYEMPTKNFDLRLERAYKSDKED